MSWGRAVLWHSIRQFLEDSVGYGTHLGPNYHELVLGMWTVGQGVDGTEGFHTKVVDRDLGCTGTVRASSSLREVDVCARVCVWACTGWGHRFKACCQNELRLEKTRKFDHFHEHIYRIQAPPLSREIGLRITVRTETEELNEIEHIKGVPVVRQFGLDGAIAMVIGVFQSRQ